MTEYSIASRVERILEAAKNSAKTLEGESRIEAIRCCFEGYAEPGYDNPVSGIVALGNWNNIDRYDRETRKRILIDEIPSRVANALEMIGVALEWSDEWDCCGECDKPFRIAPDHYGWQKCYAEIGSDRLCLECFDVEEYLEELEGEPDLANSIKSVDPGEHDYIPIESSFEHGMHRGQDSNPESIAKLLWKAGFTRFLFNVDSVSQFYFTFSVWLHKDEAEQDDDDGIIMAKRALEQGETDGPSITDAMKHQLETAGAQVDELRKSNPDAVVISKVSPDDVETRAVSREDFIRGKGGM